MIDKTYSRLPPALIFFLLLLLLLATFLSPAAYAADQALDRVILIESPGCTKCAAAQRVLEDVLPGGVEIARYVYYEDDGKEIIAAHHTKDVPAIVIGKSVINYRDYEGDTDLLRGMIEDALAGEGALPAGTEDESEASDESELSGSESPGTELPGPLPDDVTLSILVTVLAAGLLAGFNPCLLGILAFLAATILSTSGRRRDLVTMIALFSLGIFAVYFLFGLGMLKALRVGSMAEGLRVGLTVLLVVLGLFHVEDARRLRAKRPSLFRTDGALRHIEKALTRPRLSTYFLAGALFSLVKAPCVGAVYMAILELISTKNYQSGGIYLGVYNLGVVLPVLLLGLLMAFGLTPAQVDRFRKDYRVTIRLVTGLTLLVLAPLIFWEII